MARPVVFFKDLRRLEPQMSKRKPAKASKRTRTRSPALSARAHEQKHDIVKSAKDDLLRSASAVPIDSTPEWHDEPQETWNAEKQETRNAEKHVALNVEKQAAAKFESQEAPKVESQETPIAANPVQHGPGQIRGFGASATGKLVSYQMMLLGMTQANMRFAFEFGQKLLTVRSPFQLADLIVETTKM
jgi:hypothetical protein